MNIKKIINNNIVCAVDKNGREVIVTGKGIGFGKKVDDEVKEDDIRKIYCMTNSSVQRKLIELLNEIPYEYLKMTDEMVEEIKANIAYPLNESLLITLSDHISFAIQRQKDGMVYTNPLLDSIMQYYPEEFRLGKKCIELVKERTGIKLGIDEAGFIAMHIVNAELNTNMSDMYGITDLIRECMEIVEEYYGKELDRQSLSYSRFIVHIRYFAQRLLTDEMHVDNSEARDEMLIGLIIKNCPEHYGCAEKIAQLAEKKYNKKITDEEMMYLTIHLKRINS